MRAEKAIMEDEKIVPTVQPWSCRYQSEASFVGEYCNVHSRTSFAVKALSYNSSIGRLCVIRQNDSFQYQSLRGKSMSQLTLVEFYNALKLPLLFLEKSIPVNDQFEAVVWIGNWAVFGGLGGRTTLLSPFTSKFGRVQLCVSDILAMARTDETQFVVGNNSGELLVLNSCREIVDDGQQYSSKVPTFSTVQTIKLSSDEHITSIGCSKNIKPQMMAVGKVNGLSLFLYEANQWTKYKEIGIPHSKDNANIVWSLLFVDSFLFTGDAHGQTSIYSAENGTLLKTLKTHQAPILAMATDGKEVFAAGADYRIQIIKSISHNNIRFEWQQSGQRLFHTNDVRAICVMDKQWLVSGGAEAELFISDKFTHANPQIRSECAFFVINSQFYVIVSLHLSHLDLWCKTIDRSTDTSIGLKRLLRITSGKLGFIKHFCTSSDGNFIAFAGAVGGAVRVFRLICDQIPVLLSMRDSNHLDARNLIKLIWSSDQCYEGNNTQKEMGTGGKAVSAMYCTSRFLYFARGEFKLVRLDLQTKSLQPFLSKLNGGHVTKICVDSTDKCLLVLTIAGTFYFDLAKLTDDESGQMGAADCVLIPLNLPTQMPPYDCVFYDKCKIILLTTDLARHIILYDLSSHSNLFVYSNTKLNLVSNEWVAYLDVNSVGAIVATTNKARLRLLTVNEAKLRLFADESADEEISRSANVRIEPFWLEDRSNPLTKLVLIRHKEKNGPTRVPCRLRFFGKN